jgi:hypothetical protein
MVTQFGSGQLWAVPVLKAGAAVVNPTPQKFGVLQDVQIDVSDDVKELHGMYRFPVDVAAGKAKISGKAKMADIKGSLFGELFFGETVATGVKLYTAHPATNVPTTPFQITVTQGATFFRDLGVRYAASGLYLTRGATATGVGVYAVNTTTGVYTFNTVDQGASVIIEYVYTSAASGKGFSITNRLMGDKPEFELFLMQDRKGKQSGMQLNRCVSTKLTLATKLEDFTIPEFDFSAFADDANVIGTVWSPE